MIFKKRLSQQWEKIKQQRREIDDLKLTIEMMKKGFVRVEKPEESEDGDVVWINNRRDIKILNIKPLAVISPFEISGQPWLRPSDITVVRRRGLVFVRPDEIMKKLDRVERDRIADVIENYRERRRRELDSSNTL